MHLTDGNGLGKVMGERSWSLRCVDKWNTDSSQYELNKHSMLDTGLRALYLLFLSFLIPTLYVLVLSLLSQMKKVSPIGVGNLPSVSVSKSMSQDTESGMCDHSYYPVFVGA